MHISGFQSFTLSDYPGKTAAIVFTQGCNMACPFCHNSQLIPCRQGDLEGDEILRTLEKRKHVLQGVVITGGEPTLQKDLKTFCQKIHHMGMLVKLDTNGSRPQIIKQLIAEQCVDYIAMDIKAPLGPPEFTDDIAMDIKAPLGSPEFTDDIAMDIKAPLGSPEFIEDQQKHQRLTGCKIAPNVIRQSMQLIAQSKIEHHFRTTVVPNLLCEMDVQKIQQIVPSNSLHVLQKFVPDHAYAMDRL